MNILSSSISDDTSMQGAGIWNKNHENVIEQETNCHQGINKDKLLATNQTGKSNNLNNSGMKIAITIVTLLSVKE